MERFKIHCQWRVAAPGGLRWRLWDDEWVVFDSASGAIHRLNLVAGEALRLLEKHALGPQDLSEQLASLFEIEAAPAFSQHVTEMLASLDEAGLIEAIQS